MTPLDALTIGTHHTVHHHLCRAARPRPRADSVPSGAVRPGEERDRGAVSLEQVLWFVAAGVSVAVVAAILWNRIRDEANTPINSPSAP
jgi:hypothetical protein